MATQNFKLLPESGAKNYGNLKYFLDFGVSEVESAITGVGARLRTGKRRWRQKH